MEVLSLCQGLSSALTLLDLVQHTELCKLETVIVPSLAPSHRASFIGILAATYVCGLRLGYVGHSRQDFLSSC